MIDKDLVRQRFGAAVPHYDREALPQKRVAERMDELLSDLVLPLEGKIFEVGCGTGFLSEKLWHRYGGTHPLVFNDLSPDVIKPLIAKTSPSIQFIPSDAEVMDWPADCALIASASAIQWWDRPLDFFAKGYRHLRSGGWVLCGTYGTENLTELRALTSSGLTYYDRDTISTTLYDSGYRDVHLEEHTYTLHFDGLMSLLRHLKLTGVNALTPQSPWTPDYMRRIEREYKTRYSTPSGQIPLTFHAIIVLAQKP